MKRFGPAGVMVGGERMGMEEGRVFISDPGASAGLQATRAVGREEEDGGVESSLSIFVLRWSFVLARERMRSPEEGAAGIPRSMWWEGSMVVGGLLLSVLSEFRYKGAASETCFGVLL